MTDAATDELDILWFLPTHGDGRWLGTSEGARAVTLDYLSQIARAADSLGYYGMLIPTGRSCEDPWVVASALVALTRRVRFLVALRPGLTEPSVAARMASTLDRMLGGRLLLNVVAGGDPTELKGDGVWLDHAARYAQTSEFLSVWRALMSGEPVTHQDAYYHVENGRVAWPSLQRPYPPLYFGGSSEAGHAVCAEHCDVYLSWGEKPEDVAAKIAAVRAAAAARGRTLNYGIRLHVIVRETEQEAWRAADELIRYVDDDAIARSQATFARFDSVGQARMAQLHGGNRDRLVIAPNLWAGVGLVRGGAGTALVGAPEQIVARMREYQALGIDRFVLSGYPHLEECYRFAELVFPLLRLRRHESEAHSAISPMGNAGPFGAETQFDISGFRKAAAG